MAITAVKIHPAIGIARVGNSPDGFFIGPERVGDRSIPPGGYKDDMCRIKRQAAQFHIFAYHSDGTFNEIKSDQADIKWTVHLANKKASVNDRNKKKGKPRPDPKDLIIDPGPRTLTGPNQRKIFDTGKIKFRGYPDIVIPLGEIRTDESSHLLVLGGFGMSDSPSIPISLPSFYNNADWYDDTSDGPVSASIKINSTGEKYEAEGAWVIIGPPKFAPGIDNIITMYDRLFDLGISRGWTKPVTRTSYSRHIYPILERARNIRWVYNPRGAHSWTQPVTDPTIASAIFARLTAPDDGGTDMPRLIESGIKDGRLTNTQYQHMQNWKDGKFEFDGRPLPELKISPQGLDEASLENAVGGAFYPGIEAGGITKRPILDLDNYSSLFRLDHSKVSAGDITAYMALPWQADFKSCSFNLHPPPDATWWPIPRPNVVIPDGESNYQVWDRDVGTREDMAQKWDTLGFVVRKGEEYVEVDKCPVPTVTLASAQITFRDVPQGPMGMSQEMAKPIIFEVNSTGGSLTFEFQSKPSHPRLKLFRPSISIGPTEGNRTSIVKLWIRYETGAIGEVISDQVTISSVAARKTWHVSITANTVARRRTAIALVLDHSSRMADSRGDGESKYETLQEACKVFVDNMLEGDGLAIVGYNENAEILQRVTLAGSANDLLRNRLTKHKEIFGKLKPSGDVLIENGIYKGQKTLDSTGHGYDIKTLLVLTGAKANAKRSTGYKFSILNKITYGIGFGKGENTNMPLLQPLCANNNGFMLVTGTITGNKYFLLQKYFLQILAAIKNSQIVMIHQSELMPGEEQAVPFSFTEADKGMEVIFLAQYPKFVDFHLRTPSGFVIEPKKNQANIYYMTSATMSYYRIKLPVELERNRFDHGGTWNTILSRSNGKIKLKNGLTNKGRSGSKFETQKKIESIQVSGAIPYCIMVQSYSNLLLSSWLRQDGYETGNSFYLEASLLQAGTPLANSASVWAEVTRPDGSVSSSGLKEDEAGRFSGAFKSTIPGVYYIRLRSTGRSNLGYPFQREQNLSAAVWHGEEGLGS